MQNLLVHPYFAKDDLNFYMIYQSQGIIHSEYETIFKSNHENVSRLTITNTPDILNRTIP